MKRESHDEKWKQLQAKVQEGILTAYPNPEGKGCPTHEVLVELSKRAAEFDDTIEDDPQWQHVTHCSPCYGKYLEEFRNSKRRRPASSK